MRCLPLEVGNPRIFRKLIDVVKLQALVADETSQAPLKDLDIELHGTARKTSMLDVIVPKDDGLHGFHKGARACIERLGATLETKSDPPLKDRIVMLAGLSPWTRTWAGTRTSLPGRACHSRFSPRHASQPVSSLMAPHSALTSAAVMGR